MTHLLIRHRVEDFGKWKPVFEEHKSAREEAGLTDLHLWTNAEDANEVFILCDVADPAKAKEFGESPSLVEAMKNAGVIGAPEIILLVTP